MNVIWLASINSAAVPYRKFFICQKKDLARSDVWPLKTRSDADLIFIIRQIKTIPWEHYPYLENRSHKLVHIHLFDGNSFISNLQITKQVPQNSIILGSLKPFFQLHKRPSKFFRTNEFFLRGWYTLLTSSQNCLNNSCNYYCSISKLNNWFSSKYPVLNLAKTKTIDFSC